MDQRRSLKLTDADRSVLGPLAEHRILIVPQVALLLGVSEETAARRLRRLRSAGLVSYGQIMARGPGVATITRRGLNALGDSAPVPNVDLRGYRHDVGVGWLWLGAQRGAFGALDAVVTEREMRTADAAGRATAQGAPHGVGLGMLGPNGRPQRHYPDLLLHTQTGHQVAVELELTAKSRRRMSRIMTAYASDGRIDAVIYLVPNRSLARLVSDSAARAGISDLIRIQMVAADRIHGAGGWTGSRELGREPERGPERGRGRGRGATIGASTVASAGAGAPLREPASGRGAAR